MIPYEHKVLYVKEGGNFLKILLFLVVKVYSSIPLSHTNNNNKTVARSIKKVLSYFNSSSFNT